MTELKLLELRQDFENWVSEAFNFINNNHFIFIDGYYKLEFINYLWKAYLNGYNKDR